MQLSQSTDWQAEDTQILIAFVGPVHGLAGAMSDFFIYDRALTADEVRTRTLSFDLYQALALQSDYPFNLPFDLPLTRIP